MTDEQAQPTPRRFPVFPEDFHPAEWYMTTPPCPKTGRVGISFSMLDGGVFRVNVSPQSAAHLVDTLFPVGQMAHPDRQSTPHPRLALKANMPAVIFGAQKIDPDKGVEVGMTFLPDGSASLTVACGGQRVGSSRTCDPLGLIDRLRDVFATPVSEGRPE